MGKDSVVSGRSLGSRGQKGTGGWEAGEERAGMGVLEEREAGEIKGNCTTINFCN